MSVCLYVCKAACLYVCMTLCLCVIMSVCPYFRKRPWKFRSSPMMRISEVFYWPWRGVSSSVHWGYLSYPTERRPCWWLISFFHSLLQLQTTGYEIPMQMWINYMNTIIVAIYTKTILWYEGDRNLCPSVIKIKLFLLTFLTLHSIPQKPRSGDLKVF